MNPYDVLELNQGASPEEIKAAYHRLAKQWHPDRFTGAAKAEAEIRFRQLAEAFSLLKDVSRRPDAPTPRPSEPAPAAQGGAEAAPAGRPAADAPIALNLSRVKNSDEWFSEAKAAFDEGDIERAIGLTQYSIGMDDCKGEYHAFLARVLNVTGGDKRAIVKSLQTAIQLNPKDVESMILLAEQFQELGMQVRASGLWERVRNVNPNHKIFQKENKAKKDAAAADAAATKSAASEDSSLAGQFKALLGRFSRRS
jgi:curved DNA-binding protein CbpA